MSNRETYPILLCFGTCVDAMSIILLILLLLLDIDSSNSVAWHSMCHHYLRLFTVSAAF